MQRRTYRGESDVALLQAFNAAAIAETAHCGYLHTGDIPHHIFNGNLMFDTAEVLTIWEDDSGVAAWVLAGPRHRSADVQVRPDLRGGDFEREVFEFSEARTIDLMRRHGIEGDAILADAFRCDIARVDLLVELGWTKTDGPPWVLNRIRLDHLDDPIVSAGYTMRSVRGVEEAAAVAEVHKASFGREWTPEDYRTVMESPGYDAERELVAVAPDGTLAAFTVTWHDEVNRTGLFEPVGTHADHRRLGLARALLRLGMHRMAIAGMEWATVLNSGTNEASAATYRSAGFEPWYLIDDYTKPIAG